MHNLKKLDTVQTNQILGNIDLAFHTVWQPQIHGIWGWLCRFWSLAIPKLRLRLPPEIEPFRKSLVLLVVIAVAATLIAGCDSKPAGESSTAESTKAAPAGDLKKDYKDIKVGVSMYTLGAPYFYAQVNAAKKKAAEYGMQFISTEARDDMVKQLADVEDMLTQGIDLLILNPKDPQGLIPATRTATKAGVPVIVIDSSIDPAADFITTVQSNNLANGELIGEWLVKKMEGAYIKIGLLSGVQGNPVGKERRQGVFRGIIEQQLRSTASMGFEIVAQGWGNWSHEGGLKAMEDMIVAHPEMNVMLAENDSMALGAIEAIKEAGRQDDILVLACADGQKEALELIKKGEYGATGMNNPVLIAETAIEIGLKVLAGETNFPKKSYTPAVCITKKNVDKYYDPDAVF
ncbi:MAG TPA: substrate-binding domain-containing protein [Planctomycetes bacterium]|nr:substrate-binding domain-containing protein [Planctomycetota bacterium]